MLRCMARERRQEMLRKWLGDIHGFKLVDSIKG